MYEPAWPIGQLTSSELVRYHNDILQAIWAMTTPEEAAELASRLNEVRAEEESRASIAEAYKIPCQDPMQHYSA